MNEFKNGVVTYLTYAGQAKAAAEYYCSIFRNTTIETLVYYEDDSVGIKGEVFSGIINIDGTEIYLMDLPKTHIVPFSFASSLMHYCQTLEEYNHVLGQLQTDGILMMSGEDIELQGYNMQRCSWVTDKFGLTWQLILI